MWTLPEGKMYDEPTADRFKVFIRLTEKERDKALFDMLIFSNGERAKLETRITDLEQEREILQRALDGISHRKTDTLELNTVDKINAAINQRFGGWQFYLKTFLIPSLQLLHTAVFLSLIGGLVWLVLQGHKIP